ncbi:phytanoyl-CoA dioxygenase family protein [Arenibaculum pallidiluteum]|uniref:hypothetical protein n=1 Tax=Arenibaculum pallidiluteum TaxID=2812559 RepID=UPI001A9758AC|nr:hypothetical protein [Arenibaculum pallidiluteum]
MHMAQLTPAKAGFAPLKAAAYYAQRCVCHPARRRRIGSLIGRLAGAALRGDTPNDVPAGSPVGAEAAVLSALRRDGVRELGRVLDDGQVGAIRAHFESREPETRSRDGSVEEFATGDVLGCPHLLALAASPAMLRIAAAYLGCRPTISSIGVRRSHPGREDPSWGQTFHRDVDDWISLKLFVYLGAVEEGGGPHVYVEGSHRTPGGIRLRDLSADEAAAHGRPRMLLGPAGTAFLADTFGLHRGEPPRRASRLMMQVQYSVLPVGLYRYDVKLPAEALPPGLAASLDARACRLFVAPPGRTKG